jgi:Zn-dependent M28 family amino/carboxypeptidase
MKKIFLLVLVCFQLSVFGQQLFDEKVLINNLKFLSSDSLEGRRVGSGGSAKARTFIKNEFKRLKLEPLGDTYELPFEFAVRTGKQNGTNLAGVIKGTTQPNQYLVISAHYDHVGIKNERIYNGADDNASGTSALFVLVEYFQKSKPQHSILVVAFDAEEMGLQGAREFVKTPPVPINQILANINMDMIARADNNELVACGTFFYPQLKPFIEKAGSQDKIKFKFGHDDPENFKGKDNWTYSSDHGPFHTAKIPFVYFGVADHADYHQPSDDFEKIDPATYISCVKLIVKAAVEIDKGLK